MESIWEITYQGSHNNKVLKKFERLLRVRTTVLMMQRYIWFGEKCERATFSVPTPTEEWDSSLIYVLGLARLVGVVGWSISIIDETSHLEGRLDTREYSFVPTGLRDVRWILAKNLSDISHLYGQRITLKDEW